MQKDKTIPVKVKPEQQPFNCPPLDGNIWQMHPSVYLPLKEDEEIKCPYCGAIYVLESS